MRLIVLLFILITSKLLAQSKYSLKGQVFSEGQPLPYANIYIENTTKGTVTDENGTFLISNLEAGKYSVVASFTGFIVQKRTVIISDSDVTINFKLNQSASLNEVIITGTLKPVSRLESPVPVEVYSPIFLKKNPTPNIFGAL